MKAIEIDAVQKEIDRLKGRNVYVHVETTSGAYASHFGDDVFNVGAYVRNARVKYTEGKIVKGDAHSYRVGLKLEFGWIFVEGLTDWEIYKDNQLLLSGLDDDGRLMVGLQISEEPFGE